MDSQKHANLCKPKASLVYKVSSKTDKAVTQRNPVSKKRTKERIECVLICD